VRVIAPSGSLSTIGMECREIANRRFGDLGLTWSFGRHVEQCDEFGSSPIQSRLADLHDAVADPNVKAILTAFGGYNTNQLLPFVDWELIRENPKILCGYCDITALSCSMFAKTGLVTFSGPHYSSFGMLEHLDQTLEWFTRTVMASEPLSIKPSQTWSDEAWYLNQHNRTIEPNEGYWVVSEGSAVGTLIGGNLCTLNLLQGTQYMPNPPGAVVFVEDDFESMFSTFDRNLTSLTQQPGFDGVRALLIGRFQKSVGMTRSMLGAIVSANVDFGHTDPLLTLPVGGSICILVAPSQLM